MTNGPRSPHSRPTTSSERFLAGSSNTNRLPSPAQAVPSIRQSRVTQFVPPPSPSLSISQALGNSRTQHIQRTASNRGRRGRYQYPPGPSLSRSGMPVAPSLGLVVTVAIIPFKLHLSQDTYQINDQCFPPVIRIQPCDIGALLATLRKHHLVTDFSFSNIHRDSDLPIWTEFDLKLRDYLSSIDAEFADPSTFSSYDLSVTSDQSSPIEYHDLPWLFLAGGKLNRDRRKITPIGPSTFSPKMLCSIGGAWGGAASGVPNQPLLLIGCRFTEIEAPITNFPDVESSDLRHRCFAIRVYDAISKTGVLPPPERISSDVIIDCRGENRPCFEEICMPSRSPTPPSPPATPPPDNTRAHRLHPRSPQSSHDVNPAPRARQRIRGPDEPREPLLPPSTISSSSNEDIHSIIASWRTCLQLFADSCATGSEMFTIHGDSLESVSRGFLLFLHHLSHITLSAVHHTWELPMGISECGPPDFRSLLKQTISFEVGPALGQGVERSVFETIFRQLGTREFERSDLFWNAAGGFLIPRFEPGQPASFRSKWWYTYGRLLGLYIIRFGRVPQRIPPVLLLGLFSTRTEEMFVTQDTLLTLDRELAEPLRPWFEIPMRLPLPEFSRDVIDLLAGRAQMDPAIVRGDISTREEHIIKTCQIMCAVGLGRADLWSNPEFRQFREGFDIVLTNLDQDLHSLIGYTRSQISSRVGEFIQVLCDRHVQRPDQVWELCVFEELTGWATTAPYRRRAQMFQQCLRNYLFGSGTPESPPGLHVEEELADHMISATVLRGSILLAAVTECEDLPTDPDYRIQFNWLSIAETSIPTLAIHTCNGAIDISLTQELEDLMISQDGTVSFDHWIHYQLLSSRGIYNRI